MPSPCSVLPEIKPCEVTEEEMSIPPWQLLGCLIWAPFNFDTRADWRLTQQAFWLSAAVTGEIGCPHKDLMLLFSLPAAVKHLSQLPEALYVSLWKKKKPDGQGSVSSVWFHQTHLENTLCHHKPHPLPDLSFRASPWPHLHEAE